MHNAALKAEQLLRRVSIRFILLDRISSILQSELVLQLHCDNRKAIQENAEVKRKAAIFLGILQLTSHAKNVLFI